MPIRIQYDKRLSFSDSHLDKTVECSIFSLPQSPSQYVFSRCQKGKLFYCAAYFNSICYVHLQLHMIKQGLIPLLSVIIVHIEVPQKLWGATLKYCRAQVFQWSILQSTIRNINSVCYTTYFTLNKSLNIRRDVKQCVVKL